MRENQTTQIESTETKRPFIEGVDYYFENGLMVLTAHFLQRRGYCCGNGCRHCPFENPTDQSR